MIVKRSASLIVALTGGIASGKTTVANQFVQRGEPLFDADQISRELVAPGQPALAEIVVTFGQEILTNSGELDRRRMRDRVFGNTDDKHKLEAILHPRVRAELQLRALSCAAPYCILAVPLLVESKHAYDWIDRVAVVDVPLTIQLARLEQRDGMSADNARQLIAAQASPGERLAIADDVIDNGGAPEFLVDIAERLHRRYLELSAARQMRKS